MRLNHAAWRRRFVIAAVQRDEATRKWVKIAHLIVLLAWCCDETAEGKWRGTQRGMNCAALLEGWLMCRGETIKWSSCHLQELKGDRA